MGRAPRAWRFAALMAMSTLAAGCDDLPGKPKYEDRPIPFEQVLDFDMLYARSCAGCHGVDGTLGPAPPLNDPFFLALVPDAVLLETIQNGRAGTPMPAFLSDRGGTLSQAQIDVLAGGLKKKWGSENIDTADVPPYLAAEAGVAADATAGQAVFARACAVCHGEQGEGSGDEAMAGALRDAAFLRLASDQMLRRVAITGRPDLGMPNFREHTGRAAGFAPLTSQDITNVVALLASWREEP